VVEITLRFENQTSIWGGKGEIEEGRKDGGKGEGGGRTARERGSLI